MISKINRLFDSFRESSSKEPEKYHLGDVPLFRHRTHNSDFMLVIIISLFCAECVELLPRIKNIADVFDGEMILVIDGDRDEAKAIQQHFEFSIDVLSASPEDFYTVYRPEFTPYAYVINSEGIITYMGYVGNVETVKGTTIAQLGLMPDEEVSES